MIPELTVRWMWIAAGALGSLGFAARVAPMADAGGRLVRQFPTEDGYLMLTMSRNIALGNGMSIAEGTIATNGTQPLATYLYSIGFWLFGADREAGVVFAHVLQIAIAIATAVLLYRVGTRLWAEREDAPALAALTAGLWFAAPVAVEHTMNCLETGLYALCALAVVHATTSLSVDGGEGAPRLGRWAGIGALLGLAFWARNDAIMMCVAVAIVHLAGWLPNAARAFHHRFIELSLAGISTIAVASPWMISNYLNFGHIVPVSGQAQNLTHTFAVNLWRVPTKLFENVAFVLPIPNDVERMPLVIAVCALALVAVGAGVLRAARRGTPVVRGIAAVGGVYVVVLASFYGFGYGAGHFMSRYLFPTSTMLALASVGLLAGLLARMPERVHVPLGAVAVGTALCLALGLHWRIYATGTEHEHFQVVEWVEANVPDDVWVGAIQTGTLGFFHDRTINLDGKVNPAALEARRTDDIPLYVQQSPIMYLVDWTGIARWMSYPQLAGSFEVLVVDDDRNLAVLGRRERHAGG